VGVYKWQPGSEQDSTFSEEGVRDGKQGAQSQEQLQRRAPGRDRRDDRRSQSLAANPAPLWYHVLRRQRVYRRDAGDRIINEHDEAGEGSEELYLVHSGRATFELDGERVDAPAGTLVFARPAVKRTAFAEEPATTIIALGGTPGEVYQPGGWELWSPLNPLYEAGEYAEAADRGRELIAANPDYAGVIYNVACC
jgi:hypothetical protein